MLRILLLLVALVGSAPPAAVPTAERPCLGVAPAVYHHVVFVILENHDFDQVASGSPYLTGLAHRCGLAAAHANITHPSLPNYIALTSGGTQGITSDCTDCTLDVPSIFQQLGAGAWKTYAEGMPSPGYLGATSGLYAKKHNPASYYLPIRSQYRTQAVPLGSASSGPLADDVRHGRLPRYSFVVPNMCHSEHDCSLSAGDDWLSAIVPLILGGPDYARGDTMIVITYDESDAGDRIYTTIVAPSVPPGTVSDVPLTHYGLLRLAESELGLPLLGEAATASTPRSAFNL
jgi:hypothetical protein